MSVRPHQDAMKNPNDDLHEWLRSLKDLETKRKLYRDVGIQLLLSNVPIDKVEKCYFQLAAATSVELFSITEDDILNFRCTARVNELPDHEEEFEAMESSGSLGPSEENPFCEISGHGNKDDVERSKHHSGEKSKVQSSKTSSSLNLSVAVESESVVGRPRIDSSGVDITDKVNIPGNLELRNKLQENIVKENASVIAAPQIERRNVTKEPSSREICSAPKLDSAEDKLKPTRNDKSSSQTNKLVNTLSPKEKSNNLSDFKRNSVIKKPGQSSKSEIDSEKSKITDETVVETSNKKKLSYDEKPINDASLNNLEADKNINEKPCASEAQHRQMGVATAQSEKSNEIRDENGLSNDSNLLSGNVAYKAEELLVMHNLQERIAKELSKKNVHLPSRSKNTTPNHTDGKIIVPEEHAAKETEGQDKRPSIIVRKNLYSRTVEKNDSTKTNKPHSLLGDDSVSRPSNNAVPSRSSSSSKDEERKKHNNGKSDSTNLKESFNQINAQLANIKKAAESRKRMSLDLERKTATAKKRRFSDQSSASRNKETPAIQEEHLRDNGRIQLEPTVGLRKSSMESYNVSLTHQAPETIGNARNKDTLQNSTLPTHVEANTTSNMTTEIGSKNVQEKSNEPNNNSYNRQSASFLEQNLLLERLLTQQSETESANNSSTRDLISLPGNLQNISPSITVAQVPVNQVITDSPQTSNHRPVPEIDSIQNPPQTKSPSTQTVPSHSNQVVPPGISEIVQNATHRYLIFFCNKSNDNLGSIPEPVRSSLNQYCTFQKRPHFKKLSEYLKLYMCCQMALFKDDDLRKTVNKAAELLHLSIADYCRKNERKNQAARLQSVQLRKEEIDRAENDYKDIVSDRGSQLASMFLSVLPKIYQVKGCEFLMLITFYFKITQALMKIDFENESWAFNVRGLIKALLQTSNAPFNDSTIPLYQSPFFTLDTENFKECCRFVKQCLLTLYQSGYNDEGSENFWKFLRCEPVIHNLERLRTEYSLRVPGVESIGTPSTTHTRPTPPSLASGPHLDTHQRTSTQLPSYVQQTNQGMRNSSQPVSQLNVQNTYVQNITPNQQIQPSLRPNVVQNIAPNHQQRPSSRPNVVQNITPNQQQIPVRLRNPSQLPSFASLSQSVQSQQQMNQRLQPTPSTPQAGQTGWYSQAYQQAVSGMQNTNVPSSVAYPQLNRQNVRIVTRPPNYPPPPYHTTHQRVDPRTQQQQANQMPQQRVDPRTQQQQANQTPQQRVDLRTQQRVDPRTQHRVDPRTQQRVDPRMPQQVDPRTQQRVDPRTTQQVDPRTQQQVDPRTQQRVDPRTQQPADPRTQQPQLWQPSSNAVPPMSSPNIQSVADNMIKDWYEKHNQVCLKQNKLS